MSNCRLCNRPLSHPRSVALQVGPVCAKKVRAVGEAVRERMEQAGTWDQSAAERIRPGSDGWFDLADVARLEYVTARAARAAERARALQQARQPEPPREETITMWSASRGCNEELHYRFINGDNMAECRSPSGQIYTVTEDSCTCPDHEHRWHVCRHMEGIRQLRGTTPDTDNTNQTTPPVISDIHDRAPELSELDTPEDRHRNQQLQIWQQYAPEPTVWMSRDDNAWQQLYQEAGGNLEYVYGGVLGGTDNTFGIEIEFEDGDAAAIGRELYSDGLLSSATRGGYHGVSRAGMWKFESDGSVTNGNFGGEIVSPVLVDSAETWRQLEHITEVVRRHGGHATDATGGHIHIGMDPLDDRAYRWQRLARIGMGYEKQLFRMGAADDEQFQRGSYGTHRGVSFTNPLPESARKLYGETLTADEARRLLVDYQHRGHGARYTMFNTTKYINNGVPTVEFRYPNGTLDARQIQAQVRVTNALLFQSASLRQDTAQGQLMPGLSQSQNQYRMNNHYTEQQETEGFRKFLDLIGNKDVQLAATWLWRRGRA